MNRSIHMLTLAIAALALTGCDEWGEFGDSQRYREDFHYSYDLKPGGRFSLETMNGSVEISSWEKNTVDISGTKYASEEAALRAIRIDITNSPDSIYVRTVRPSGFRSGLGARYIIRVPKSVELDNINSSNGAVRVENIEGNGRVRTSNGSVRVNQVKGRYEVTTSNGALEVNDQTGGLLIDTSNGGVRAENIRGALEAVTSNCRITARLLDPDQNRPINFQRSIDSIDITMDFLMNKCIRAIV